MQHLSTALLVTAVLGLATGCGDARGTREVHAAPMAPDATHPAFLYGRVTTVDGEVYLGRLRFGASEEAFWGDYFNGRRDVNPWIEHMPARERPRQGRRIFGITFGADDAAIRRPFMARMGDIAKLEASGRDLWVTMKSGTVHHLNRYAADDFADGVRIWDSARGVVDLNERDVRTIEFEAPVRTVEEAPYRLHGLVRTREGDFTGFIQWGRDGSVALDELRGGTAEGEVVALPWVTIRSLERTSSQSGRVTLLDGRQIEVSDDGYLGAPKRGIYVDDARYGRVLVSWDAFQAAVFTPVGANPADGGPGYEDFPAGRPLTGTVTTRSGDRHTGRIVFDLDETEFTETLDAPSRGVDYTLPFERVQSIVLPGGGGHDRGLAAVNLRGGEQLQLERAGDLRRDNGGLLIFAGRSDASEYVRWADVVRIDFEHP